MLLPLLSFRVSNKEQQEVKAPHSSVICPSPPHPPPLSAATLLSFLHSSAAAIVPNTPAFQVMRANGVMCGITPAAYIAFSYNALEL